MKRVATSDENAASKKPKTTTASVRPELHFHLPHPNGGKASSISITCINGSSPEEVFEFLKQYPSAAPKVSCILSENKEACALVINDTQMKPQTYFWWHNNARKIFESVISTHKFTPTSTEADTPVKKPKPSSTKAATPAKKPKPSSTQNNSIYRD